MKRRLNKDGFTLIEVVLVLAIGGLIFLMAFLAFAQASKNRRDTQRRADLGTFISELQNYAGDNNGVYPSPGAVNTVFSSGDAGGGAEELKAFASNYLGGNQFRSPDGTPYRIGINYASAAFAVAVGGQGVVIAYGFEQRCSGNNAAPFSTGNSNNIAAAVNLEGNTWSCREID